MEELLGAVIGRLEIIELKIARIEAQIAALPDPPDISDISDQSYASARQAVHSAAEELRLMLDKALP